MHAMGFWHEHTRPDRDKHVKIIPENIVNGSEINFHIININQANLVGEYDMCSVMHYSMHSHSKNKKPTIVPHGYEHCSECYGVDCTDCYNCPLSTEENWNDKDIEKINLYYKCKAIGK